MKNILITGATSGIGKACAQKLFRENRLILCGRDASKVARLANEFSLISDSVSAHTVDVMDLDSINSLFDSLSTLGVEPDVLINSAGAALGLEYLEESSPVDIKQMIDTNVTGLLYMSQKVLSTMKKNNHGHIVNIGSIAGITSYAKGVVYAATKSAVKSVSDGLRKEVLEWDIKITNIQPGLVETNFSNTRFKGDTARAKKVYTGIVPLTAEDIADAVWYAINVPKHVQINEITLTPLHQAGVENIFRTA